MNISTRKSRCMANVQNVVDKFESKGKALPPSLENWESGFWGLCGTDPVSELQIAFDGGYVCWVWPTPNGFCYANEHRCSYIYEEPNAYNSES